MGRDFYEFIFHRFIIYFIHRDGFNGIPPALTTYMNYEDGLLIVLWPKPYSCNQRIRKWRTSPRKLVGNILPILLCRMLGEFYYCGEDGLSAGAAFRSQETSAPGCDAILEPLFTTSRS